ncbi:MAG TPA: hypothetical protein VMU65_13520 [Candidatus Saccharimonadales bacterium]|nr:hypothetical protein [Candidatus Saccharimonadales bacterium]
MSRVTTIITGPDGSVTTIVTRRSGCGCLTFLAAVIVLFGPAAWFGAWAVPAYIFLGVLAVAAVASSLRKNVHRTPKPTPAPAPPPAP